MIPENKNPENDDILSKIEKQLDEIEAVEIMSDMTKDSLEEKGLIGSGKYAIARQETENEGLLFEENVDYERFPDTTDTETINAEALQNCRTVVRGQLLATRKAEHPTQFSSGNNVVMSVEGQREYYHASENGKVVIAGGHLHVVPSDRNGSFRIYTDDIKLNAFIDCIPSLGSGTPINYSEVMLELGGSGIKNGIRNDAITTAIEESQALGKTVKGVCIARGNAPSCGNDGTITYAFTTEHKDYDFTILPDGRIDYRKSKNIIMVAKGDLLATIIPPTTGRTGVDVYGEMLPGESGNPASIVAGNGVKVSEDGLTLYADMDGSVLVNGSVIDVVNTYIVDGDVSYSTGNINFNGSVIVNGSVPDGFEVKAEGDIIITGIVEAAKIEADRDIVIKGGIQGRGKGIVSAGRDIRTGYSQNARLEAQGMVYIDNFAINSSIYTSKSLIMKEKRGAVIGGEISAQRGIDVKMLGSENGGKTIVEAGTNYLLARKIKELDDAIDFFQTNAAKIDASLKTLYMRLKAGKVLDPSLKKVVSKAIEKRKDFDQRKAIMLARRSDLQKQAIEKEECYIKVSQTCYSDVHLKIREARTVITKPRGKVRFYEDRKTGQIESGAY